MIKRVLNIEIFPYFFFSIPSILFFSQSVQEGFLISFLWGIGGLFVVCLKSYLYDIQLRNVQLYILTLSILLLSFISLSIMIFVISLSYYEKLYGLIHIMILYFILIIRLRSKEKNTLLNIKSNFFIYLKSILPVISFIIILSIVKLYFSFCIFCFDHKNYELKSIVYKLNNHFNDLLLLSLLVIMTYIFKQLFYYYKEKRDER